VKQFDHFRIAGISLIALSQSSGVSGVVLRLNSWCSLGAKNACQGQPRDSISWLTVSAPLIGLTDIITEWIEERFPGVVGVDSTGINMPPDFEEP
jgi:hypothetical protein